MSGKTTKNYTTKLSETLNPIVIFESTSSSEDRHDSFMTYQDPTQIQSGYSFAQIEPRRLNPFWFFADTSPKENPIVIEPSTHSSNIEKIESFLINKYRPIKGVLAAHISIENGFLEIWTVLNSTRRNLRTNLFKKQLELQTTFSEIDFDFKIKYSKKGDSKSVLPDSGITCFAT